MKRTRRVTGLIATALIVVALAGQLAQASPRLTTIAPDAVTDLRERVPVNFVFVGYDRDQVDVPSFKGQLPMTYEPIARIPSFYEKVEPLGIRYTYDYDLFFSSKDYEHRLFSALRRFGKEAPLTTYQLNYNDQLNNVLDIDTNFEIPAAAAEKWLAENPPTGVDTTENTLFFINWYGREDFKFHVYTHIGEAKPDTGYDFGTSSVRRFIAWGGTTPDDPETGWGKTRRVWFYDLSAGPEYWTRNWFVDGPDSDNDGTREERNPPVWEYTDGGYKEPSKLTFDLAKVARFVGLNLLFTPSPLYPPGITPPELPNDIAIDLNFYDISEADLERAYLRPDAIDDSLTSLTPYRRFLSDLQRETSVDDPQHAACYAGWLAWLGPSCYANLNYFSGDNMFLYNALNRDRFFDDKKADYEAGSFNYILPAGAAWRFATCLAFADGNPHNGKQTFIYSYVTATCIDRIGFTDLLIHEYGHHFGMSHQHDGYDSERKRSYSAVQDAWMFAFAGTENNSVMSYTNVNNEFSQFDRDNINRWLTAAYVDAARDIAATLTGNRSLTTALVEADELATAADRAFAEHRYLAAVENARSAYLLLVRAATKAGIEVEGDDSAFAVEGGDRSARSLSFPVSVEHRAYVDVMTDEGDFLPWSD